MTTYGISAYGPPNLYGLSRAAVTVPGGTPLPLVDNAYLVSLTAAPADYGTILLTWTGPDPSTATPMTGFRLLMNRDGFPVDENDGQVLLDTAALPASQSLADTGPIPGNVSYYGFYVNSGTAWVRSGFTACLMPYDYGYGGWLHGLLPEYLRAARDGELTADHTGNTYLSQFLNVAGWGLAGLKTRYDFLFATLNSPMDMSLSDLARLAAELGVPFTGEVPAWNVRKAVAAWPVLMRARGSVSGIADHIAALSGYGADVQTSVNFLLENDQSRPSAPSPAPFSPGIPYRAGDLVSWPAYPAWVVSQSYQAGNPVAYDGACYIATAASQGIPPAGAVNSGAYWGIAAGPMAYTRVQAVTSLPASAPPDAPGAGQTPDDSADWQFTWDVDSQPPYSAGVTYDPGQRCAYGGQVYTCTAAATVTGTAPSGTASSTADWAYQGPAGTDFLTIEGLAGGQSTWEALTAAAGASAPSAQAIPAGTLTEGIATRSPLNFGNDWSQNTFRVTNRGAAAADTWLRTLSRTPDDVTAGTAVPDPQTVTEHAIPVPQPPAAWDASVRYAPGDTVTAGGITFRALRACTGSPPPRAGQPLNANVSFEGTIAPWTASTGAEAALSAAQAYHGQDSLAVTPGGGYAYPRAVSEPVPVIPGASYTASAWFWATAAPAQGCQVQVNWSDPFGTLISQSSATASKAAGAWTRTQVTATAPATAATAVIQLQVTGTPAAQPPATAVAYWDLAALACTATPDWEPLGADERIPVMISAYCAQDFSQEAAAVCPVTPFAEFYDAWGNLITRAVSRAPLAGYAYDSFDTGTVLAGRLPDAGTAPWTVPEGAWTAGQDGAVWPAVAGDACLGLLPAPLSCAQAVTFTSAPAAGQDTGLIFWWQSASSYWHAGTAGLWYYAGGAWAQTAAYAAPFGPGDRVIVVTSQTAPSVAVYRNVIGPYSPATGDGLAAQVTGTAVPAAALPGASAQVYSGIASEAV